MSVCRLSYYLVVTVTFGYLLTIDQGDKSEERGL